MSNKVTVISNNYSEVIINIPELHLNRVWEKKGAKKMIDFDQLQEAFYDPGVEYMFTHGILYIEDMEVKKLLGLEPDDATEPENIIILSDDQKERYLKRLPLADFKIAFAKLSREEQIALAQYAVENHIDTGLDKGKVIREVTHIDVMKILSQEE